MIFGSFSKSKPNLGKLVTFFRKCLLYKMRSLEKCFHQNKQNVRDYLVDENTKYIMQKLQAKMELNWKSPLFTSPFCGSEPFHASSTKT